MFLFVKIYSLGIEVTEGFVFAALPGSPWPQFHQRKPPTKLPESCGLHFLQVDGLRTPHTNWSLTE